jgi:serine/threonine protein kinase
MARHHGSPSSPAGPASNGPEALSGYAFEALRQDGELVLYRASRDGPQGPVLVVAPAREGVSASSLTRLEHEFALRGRLPAEGVARPLALRRHEGRPLLVLEDPGGEPLERLCGAPWALGAFLRVAVSLAAAVGRLHGQGLIHKDLKPANVLVDRAGGKVSLTGFGLASRLPRERAAPDPPEYLAGTLAYLAPEQTGRMNRSVDSRADLYALGVIFYQLLTGAPPFQATDAMGWVHCHIARPPGPYRPFPAGRTRRARPAAYSREALRASARA